LPPGAGAVEEVVIGHRGEVGLDLVEVLEVRAHGEAAAEALVEVVLEVVEVLAAEDRAGPGK